MQFVIRQRVNAPSNRQGTVVGYESRKGYRGYEYHVALVKIDGEEGLSKEFLEWDLTPVRPTKPN